MHLLAELGPCNVIRIARLHLVEAWRVAQVAALTEPLRVDLIDERGRYDVRLAYCGGRNAVDRAVAAPEGRVPLSNHDLSP